MEEFEPGDHIEIWCGPYWHHAIYVGRSEGKIIVIHHRGKNEGGNIREEAVDAEQYRRVNRPSDPEATLSRARSRCGEGGYDVREKNCEHFARWCTSGTETSPQIVEHTTRTFPRVIRGACNLLTRDRTPLELVVGLRGGAFAGSAAVTGAAGMTAGRAELVQRAAVALSRSAITAETSFSRGLTSAPDLAVRPRNGRSLHYNVAEGTGASATLHAASRPARGGLHGANFARSILPNMTRRGMALHCVEIVGHAYNVFFADDKVMATAKAAGSFGGYQLGSWLTGLAACAFGLTGPLAGAAALLGGSAMALGGNYLASRVVDRGRELGGVDLGLTLHFADNLSAIDGIVVDPVEGFAVAASEGNMKGSAFGELTCHDLATIMKVVYFNHAAGSFSLDPMDKEDPFGPLMTKVFHPEFLGGTDVGELLFRADVLLKRLSLGLEMPGLPGWRGPFELGASAAENAMHRLWIVPCETTVDLKRHPRHPSSRYIHAADVRIMVRACAQVLDPGSDTGLSDSVITDPNDSAALMAAQCTRRMQELIAYYPTLQRLQSVYQAAALCLAMRQLGVTVDYRWVELHATPLFETPGRVPTLRNSRTTRQTRAVVGSSQSVTHTRSLVGGCILLQDSTRLVLREVEDSSPELERLLSVAHRQRGSYVPDCYRLGQSLNEDRSPLRELEASLERGEEGIAVQLPRPTTVREPRVVSLPFAAQVRFQCAVCGCALVEDAEAGWEGADAVRYQSILGVPLCSRVHAHEGEGVAGPFFRLTKYQPCAVCGEAITGRIITSRSSHQCARDYHEWCAPPEVVEDLAKREEEQSQWLGEMEAQLLALQAAAAEGNLLGGGGLGAEELMDPVHLRQARVAHYSTGNELEDTQRALYESVSGAVCGARAAAEQGKEDEEEKLGRALALSMSSSPGHRDGGGEAGASAVPIQTEEAQLQMALDESAAAQGQGEDEELEMALAISLSLAPAQQPSF